MSLVGNLEDLSLPDILQIVSLSRKSGILTIEKKDQQGRIFIREGKVIQTVSPRSGRTLGEILSARGLIREEDLKKALATQASGEKKELLGSILISMGLIRQEVLEKVVQEQIEESIVYFLSWREGTFSFELSNIESRGEVSVDPHAFILEKGIDTQWLVLEGTRLMDERSRAGTGTEEASAPSAGEEGGEGGTPEGRAAVVLVDDDPIFRDLVKERLTRLNYRVVACEGSDEGIKAAEEFSPAFPPTVITDIVYPTSDGRGFLGGLELIEKLNKSRPEIPVIAVTAYPDENVRSKTAEFGASHFLVKPSGTGNVEEEEKAFFDGLAAALAEVGGLEGAPDKEKEEAPDRSEREGLIEAIDEKKSALAVGENNLSEAGLDRDEMALLQDMMRELQDPRATSEIGLLILRFAAELLNRAVLFIVKGGRAVGLGGFGIEGPGSVRGISIPLDKPSFLGEVVQRRGPCRGPVVHTEWNVKLMEGLGGKTPAEAIAIPLVAGGRVRVVLYGDNLPADQPLPRTEALEIFLVQAGLTLERVLLEKKLREGGSPGGPAEAREDRRGKDS